MRKLSFVKKNYTIMDDSYNLLSYLPGFELEFLDKLRKN